MNNINIFAWLFYPRKLKEVITALQEKNDLNEEAIKHVNKKIIGGILFSIIIAVFIYGDFGVIVSLIFLLLMFIGIRYDIYRHYIDYMGVYVDGLKIKVTLIGKTSRYLARIDLVCMFRNHEKITTPALYELHDNQLALNTEIELFHDSSYKLSPMPNIKYIKRKYCLSKKIVKE